MDGDLLEEWTTVEPQRCGACTALARARDRIDDSKREHPEALKVEPGLREGWEERLHEARAERATRASSTTSEQ